MRRRSMTPLHRFGFAAILIAVPALTALAFSGLSGAIFTTLADGSRVNANLYESKPDVYLDGGPGVNAPQGAAGLPDGNYYFQVTDPSGQVLLSTDPVQNREFQVAGGIIVGLSGAGNHVTGVDIDHGATTVQLFPFDDTPNNGGVYKAWVTRVEDFVGDATLVDNGYSPGYFHGFIPACSKTDNFKVRQPRATRTPCLTVTVFKDWNSNGRFDRNGPDYVIDDTPVTVIDPLGAMLNGPLFMGQFGIDPIVLCNLTSGAYQVSAEVPDGMFLITARLDNQSIPLTQPFEVEIGSRDRELIIGFQWLP